MSGPFNFSEENEVYFHYVLGICHYLGVGNYYVLKSSIRVTKGLSYLVSGDVKPFMDAIRVADILNKLGLEGYTLLPGFENPLTSLFMSCNRVSLPITSRSPSPHRYAKIN